MDVDVGWLKVLHASLLNGIIPADYRHLLHHPVARKCRSQSIKMRCVSIFSAALRCAFRKVYWVASSHGALVSPTRIKIETNTKTHTKTLWTTNTWNWRLSNFWGSASRKFSTHKIVDDVEKSATHRAYIAVGSNLGDRFRNIASALELLCDNTLHEDSSDEPTHVSLSKTSFLYETAPMYLTEQPSFFNGVVEVTTNLAPHELLRRLKTVEKTMGRDFQSMRNGPRPVDLDVVLYESRVNESHDVAWVVLDTPELTIPHPRMDERDFVLRPLCELVNTYTVHPLLNVTIHELLNRLKTTQSESSEAAPAVRVLPLPRGRMLHFDQTIVMGILNVTPDSFSDGGKLQGSVEVATKTALQMEQDGARIIDIGGESTRPFAKEVRIEEELTRVIPVIQAIREVSDVPISIDTRHAEVARAAVETGADIVNDVSGGTFDPQMLATVAELRVPVILMHMRGTPETMQELTEYDDVVSDVASALLERSRAAELAGIPRWMQILDPGIGFAKDMRGNLLLLQKMSHLRSCLGDIPLLLGTSRKGFIGKIACETKPEARDFGTVASCVAALCLGDGTPRCNLLRVHNVKGMKQATMVMDAIINAK